MALSPFYPRDFLRISTNFSYSDAPDEDAPDMDKLIADFNADFFESEDKDDTGWSELRVIRGSGVVSSGSRKNLFELHLRTCKENLLNKSAPKVAINGLERNMIAFFDYRGLEGFFQLEAQPLLGLARTDDKKSSQSKTKVRLRIVESFDEPGEEKDIRFTLPQSATHYEVETAVWKKIEEVFPCYRYDRFLDSAQASLYVAHGQKCYEWVCRVYYAGV